MGTVPGFIRNNLSFKILLVLSVSVTVVMGTVIYLNTKYQRSQAKESMKTFGRELKSLAYAGLKHPMSVGDSSSVKQQLLAINGITRNTDIAICDLRQRIVFANHEDEINREVSHFIHNREALADLGDLLRTGTPRYEKSFEEEVDGKKYLITIHRILNHQVCYHCHGAGRKILGGMIVRQSTDELYASMAGLRNRTILISFLGMITIISLVYLMIARLVTRPVADLSENAVRVAGGDLSVYCEVKTEDSVGALCRSFNSMITTIKDQHDELELKIGERSRQLEEAQEELVRKEKLAVLGQLAGSVAHELRNPLAVMSNAVYYLKAVLPDSDKTLREYLKIIKTEIDNSERIITDLLDFSRTKTPHMVQITVGEIITRIIGKCSVPELVSVEIDIAGTLPPVNVDPFQMGQVFQNLITNSIEAMSNKGVLKILAEEGREDGFVRIHITDTGEGISPEGMAKLFRPLFTTKAKGMGLGLAVCKRLTEANGGTIEVKSRPGDVTTFTVALPAINDNDRTKEKEINYKL